MCRHNEDFLVSITLTLYLFYIGRSDMADDCGGGGGGFDSGNCGGGGGFDSGDCGGGGGGYNGGVSAVYTLFIPGSGLNSRQQESKPDDWRGTLKAVCSILAFIALLVIIGITAWPRLK